MMVLKDEKYGRSLSIKIIFLYLLALIPLITEKDLPSFFLFTKTLINLLFELE